MNELALFAGVGGGILGGVLLGWKTVCAVEKDPYAAAVLVQRQNDGTLTPFPIWDDVQTFDGGPWRGIVDVVSGGFPCQDISSAGKRKGIDGPSSGLVHEMLRIVSEIRPPFVFAENSPHLRTRGLGRIVQRMAGMGYVCRWCVLGDCHAGGATLGARLWLVAKAYNQEERTRPKYPQKAFRVDPKIDRVTLRIQQRRRSWENGQAKTIIRDGDRRAARCPRASDGLAHRMDRIRTTGNGQVASLAALAWEILK